MIAALLWIAGCTADTHTDHAAESLATQTPTDDHDHDGEAEHGHDHEGHSHENEVAAEAENIIHFSRELQEQLTFATSVATKRELHRTIHTLGEIKPAGSAQREVFAPFEAILQPCESHGLVRPGQRVNAGDVLVDLAPSSSGETGWQRLLKEYRLAISDYERVAKLHASEAVSSRRLEEARLEADLQESRLRGALGGYAGDLDESMLDAHHFHLVAPATGVLTDVHLRYGQHVNAGEHLFDIIDPTKLWLEALVPASQSRDVETTTTAYFQISGSDSILFVDDFDGHLVTASSLLDPGTRRVPVIFELNNKDQLLRPGSFAQVFLQTSEREDLLAIPKSAIVEEDGIPVVFRQLGAEAFEKVVVTTGLEDGEYVAVLSGIEYGDRVVSEGAYKLRLAGLKTDDADGAHAGHSH
jgi:RND family efflux transporter MFP subunit